MRERVLQLLIGSLVFAPKLSVAADCTGPQGEGVKAVAGACNDTGLTLKLNKIIDTLFIVAGAVAVIILIIGGIRYITSTGDSKRIQAAKDTILYAIFGIIIIILARAIVGFVIGQVA